MYKDDKVINGDTKIIKLFISSFETNFIMPSENIIIVTPDINVINFNLG